MRRTVISAVAAATLVGAVALAGCSGSSGGPTSESAAGNAAAPARVAGSGGAASAPEPGAAPQAAAGSGSVVLSSRALVRTASLSVRVDKASAVGRRADAAGRIATAAGGSVYSDDRTSGKHATARLTLKVPPPQLASVLDQLAGLGKQTARRSSTEDVTTQAVDVASRVKSARASLDRLRALYGEATKVRDVIAIEQQITSRESDLESLEAQQRSLASRTDRATVHLTLTAAPAPVSPAGGGFGDGLRHGWHAFTTAVGALVTAFGAALPFLVVLAVAAALGWLVRRRVRGGTTRPPDPSPAE